MNGVLCIDKPEGLTSFSTVSKVSRLLSRAKCGHIGTLDPMATGVLPVLVGGATKFADYLPNHDKAYRATVKLGLTTDTLDITGTVLTRKDFAVTANDFENALSEFRGEIFQIPPMYSAISQNGVRLYDLARRGIEVEREKRNVTVYSLELVESDEKNGEYVIDVKCSKGTYVRSLAGDIGEKLGCGAVLTSLRRTVAAGYGIDECVGLEKLEEIVKNGDTESVLKPVESAFESFAEVYTTEAQTKRFRNGGFLSLDRLDLPNKANGLLRVFSNDGKLFLGLGEICREEGILKVKRLMVYGE